MQRVDLTAQSRQTRGKGAARKLRAQGLIPAVLYGGERPPIPLTMQRRNLALALQGHEGHHLLVELTVEGQDNETALAFLQALDINPINQMIEHADFRRVDPNKAIRTTVPVHVSGLPLGVRQGGVLMHNLREVDIEALPTEIPENITHDISNLTIGQSLHVSDLAEAGQTFTILTPGDRVVAGVHAPRAATTETGPAAEGAEAAGEPATGEAKES
jgi:large subunit ribosomal protein L25